MLRTSPQPALIFRIATRFCASLSVPLQYLPAVRFRSILVFVLLIGVVNPAMGAYPVEVIELQGRPAAEMVPLIEPFLGPDETVAGEDYTLIVRASPEHMEEIRDLLARLDTAPQALLIHVRQRVPSRREDTAVRYGTNQGLGKHTHVAPGNPPTQRGMNFSTSSVHSRRESDLVQTVQALEGHPAFISTGRDVPIKNEGIGRRNYSSWTYYKPARSGYEVIARLHGAQVTLEILHQREQPSSEYPQSNMQFETQQLRTTVTGRLGEWIALGKKDSDSSASRSDVRVRARTRTESDQNLEVLVELASPAS